MKTFERSHENVLKRKSVKDEQDLTQKSVIDADMIPCTRVKPRSCQTNCLATQFDASSPETEEKRKPTDAAWAEFVVGNGGDISGTES